MLALNPILHNTRCTMARMGWFVCAALLLCFAIVHGDGGAVPVPVRCEDLEADKCAMAVSWRGNRCVLERGVVKEGEEVKSWCQTSTVMSEDDERRNWVESDECMALCSGVTTTRQSRMTWVGMSTDALEDEVFKTHICSWQCQSRCPNIVGMFGSLAQGQGISLPSLCKSHHLKTVIRQKHRKLIGSSPLLMSSAAETYGFSPLSSPGGHQSNYMASPPSY